MTSEAAKKTQKVKKRFIGWINYDKERENPFGTIFLSEGEAFHPFKGTVKMIGFEIETEEEMCYCQECGKMQEKDYCERCKDHDK